MIKRFFGRKSWIAAILFLLLELALGIWPAGWIGGEYVSWHTGAGSYLLEGDYEQYGVCQEFSPVYSGVLKSIGIVVKQIPEEEGKQLTLLVSDEANVLLAQQEIPYTEIEEGRFTDIPVNISVKAGKKYYFTVGLDAGEGESPALLVLEQNGEIPENQRLTFEEEVPRTQLLTRYTFENVIFPSKLIKWILISMATAFLIGMPLPDKKWLRRVLCFGAVLGFPLVAGIRLELLTNTQEYILPFSMKWNIGIMYVIALLLAILFGSLRWGPSIAYTFLLLIYSVNSYVYTFRGAPFRYNDLTAVKTAADVVGGYDLTPDTHLTFAWGIGLFFIVLIWKTGETVKKWYLHLGGIALGSVLGAGCIHVLLDTDFLLQHDFVSLHGFDQLMTYQFDGYLVATCIDIQNSRIKAPDGYSEQKAEELLMQYADMGSDIAGDSPEIIIVIMNESFSDLRVLGNLQMSEENLQFFNGLEENTIRGNLNVSVLGGGTANTEFEVLTGCSLGLLPASYYAYQQCMTEKTDSLVSLLRENGYTAYSMHPESSGNWNREKVYQYLQFDKSFWREDFSGQEIIHSGVSDRATYQKIEELYENREAGEKLFIFDVTMQNHGDYEEKESEPEQRIKALNVRNAEVDLYLSLIRESDSAFEELVQYFEKQDTRTMICMFGDHQPKFTDDIVYENLYGETEGLSEGEKVFRQYKTPFLIWTNYGVEEKQNMEISANYLGALVLQTAEIKGNAFFNFLQQEMEEYPVLTTNGYRNAAGELLVWPDTEGIFADYRIMQYKLLFDR